MARYRHNRWVEISVEADLASVDDLVGLLGRHCEGGAVVEHRPDEGLKPSRQRVRIKGFLPERDENSLRKLEIGLLLLGRISPISEPYIAVLEPEDWAESWKAHFPPQHIGAHTVIVPTWREYLPKQGEVVIGLDPGMAFGTGLHATTRLCLRAIERYLRQGMKVLDVGTGSGILAISAALQGAWRVHAIDIDPLAVRVARENAALNRVSNIVRIRRATLGTHAPRDVPQHTGTSYDLVLANILSKVIVDMLPDLAGALDAGGTLVASGITQEQAGKVAGAFRKAAVAVRECAQEDGWVAIIGDKG